MGYYIEVPKNKNKAEQLMDLYGAEILAKAPENYFEDPAIICVVDNGPFEAAAFCYDKKEFEVFKQPDVLRKVHSNLGIIDLNPIQQRPRIWVTMNRALAEKLTNYDKTPYGIVLETLKP